MTITRNCIDNQQTEHDIGGDAKYPTQKLIINHIVQGRTENAANYTGCHRK